MYETQYHRASSVQDAVSRMEAAGEGKYVSGGMTLIPTMKQRLAAPSDLIDLRHIAEMQGITVSGRSVRIGAATTHYDVASSVALRTVCPAICNLASHIGDPHVRHMGTIGGSIANNDPAADYPAAMLALGATIVTNRREIAADDFSPASSKRRWKTVKSSSRSASTLRRGPPTRSSPIRHRAMR